MSFKMYNFLYTTGITDLIIAGIALLATGSVVFAVMLFRKDRSRWLTSLLLLLAGLAVIIPVAYGMFWFPNQLVVREQTIDLEDYEGEPFTAILMADFHVGKYNNSYRLNAAVKKAFDIDAKYVFILGDMVNSTDEYFDDLGILEQLADKKWVYAIYGNHDYDPLPEKSERTELVDGLSEKLASVGVAVLDNSAIWTGETPENTIIIGGIRDIWAGDQKTDFTKYINEEDTFILLSHNPDAVLLTSEGTLEKEKVDLVISGHTHGGESRLPLIGPLSPLPTELPDSYDQGLHTYNDIPMYITSGIGSIGTRMRLFNPPEIVVLTII
jgi:uncharacterized protein